MAVILPVLVLGLMASLSPSTIVVFILLLLGTLKARVNTVAFLVGWGLSLTVLFTVSYALGASQTSPRNNHTAAEVAELLLGILLVGVAVRQWQGKDTPAPALKNAVRAGGSACECRCCGAGPPRRHRAPHSHVGVRRQPCQLVRVDLGVVKHANVVAGTPEASCWRSRDIGMSAYVVIPASS